ncbi:MAG TPA: YggS family pyridoxal phosphate-dependent enzyme [Ignavibacteriales bacterium]|nr:YggS family pyridoxal phosphate-dependent enzyme [Bacteroidales bacterium]HOJ36650.1 YggS family pyridoxal phosphate-dependent enzyme [Ignavibacteriales bacterium]HOL81866.1 YggS family pyridoxal phosphate-dependent enzyme [Ignavibacteriales bacterium]HOM65033.1 YggS family pyridoxal phosphate-dependent enzyme [Ignavibacteriales bacterium]HPD67235.1 YggS family pyridoxal phosphate-dependent enzyme [Ignavibacteriales bacterium]
MEEKLKHISQKINSIISPKKAENITLIAVSKSVGISLIKKAYELGIRNFGESKAQELREKAKILSCPDIKWHFIGTLQKNKVKYVVPVAELIHSVDSYELLIEINKEAIKYNKIQNCLLEFKTSDEETKSGIETKDEILEILANSKQLTNINIIGLMTISPFVDDTNIVRNSFQQLYNLRKELNSLGYNLPYLSMGMSGDYEIAIEEGANFIRIGTYIFGERDYSKSWREIINE